MPNFFILGAPKCGTTSMYYWLKQHKNIFFPDIKEPHYFSTDLRDAKRAIRNINDYMYLFKSASCNHKIISEASVFYLYSKNAVDNILKFNRHAKFLVMLRNPVDMALSLHNQYLYTGNEIYKDFEKAWRLQDKRLSGAGITSITEDPQLLQYGKVCKLGDQVQRLLLKVDSQNVLFISLDAMKSNPKMQVEKVFDFLEIKYCDIDYGVHNIASKRKLVALHRFIKIINGIKKRLGFKKLNTGFGEWFSITNTTIGKKCEISNELRNELWTYFSKDSLLLEKLVNIKLSGRSDGNITIR